MKCPQDVSNEENEWLSDNTCSYCGSLNPETFLREIEAGSTITPTDKNYKAYLNTSSGRRKFYFEHLSDEQKAKFVQLCNDKKLKFEYPGYFYILPYFCKAA
jgi:hypothetical protein